MKRNILLIVLPCLLKSGNVKSSKVISFKAFPYGVLSIASYLKSKAKGKVNVGLLDCNLIKRKNFLPVIKKKICEFKPDIVGLSMAYGNSYIYLNDIASLIKEHNKDIVVVLGGSTATLSYVSIFEEQKYIDSICFYEGEIPFLKLVKSKNMLDFLKRNKSWITRESIKEGRVPEKSLVKNLDDVINIDYSLVDTKSYSMVETFSPFAPKIKRKQFYLGTSRGCPFGCVFCTNSADKDKTMRYASIDGVIKHVKFLIAKYKMNVLTINDDQFFFNKPRAKRLFRELAKFNLRIECPSGLSVAFMDEELIKLMRNAGMDSTYLAIESGSPYVLNNIIHKPLKLEMVKPVVQSLRKYGFWINGCMVTGLPGETDEHRDETIEFIKKVGLDWSCFTPAVPIKGTDLYKICMKNGYIKKNMSIYELGSLNKFIINTPEYSADYVTKKTYLMNLEVNFVENFRMRNGEYQVAADAFTNVIKKYPGHAFACYYLAQALFALKKDIKAVKAMEEYKKIVKKDRTWKEYARHFNIN